MGSAHCPLCQSLARKLPFTKSPLYHCPTCDLIYKDRLLHLSADEERRRYEAHDNTLQNEGYVRVFQEFIENAITPFVEREAAVLDFGCGPTPVLKELLEERGFTVDAYDPLFAPSPHRIGYNLVTCTEVLEHVFDPLDTWRRLLSSLSSNGIIAVMTHFHPGEAEITNWWYIRDNTHVVFYSAQTFTWVAQEFNLTILYNDGTKTVVLRN